MFVLSGSGPACRQRRHPEAVDHVGRGELEGDRASDRDAHLVGGGDPLGRVADLPPPLVADDLHDEGAGRRPQWASRPWRSPSPRRRWRSRRVAWRRHRPPTRGRNGPVAGGRLRGRRRGGLGTGRPRARPRRRRTRPRRGPASATRGRRRSRRRVPPDRAPARRGTSPPARSALALPATFTIYGHTCSPPRLWTMMAPSPPTPCSSPRTWCAGIGDLTAVDGVSFHIARGRDLRAARPQRRRQDHDDLDRRRPAPGRRRRGNRRGPADAPGRGRRQGGTSACVPQDLAIYPDLTGAREPALLRSAAGPARARR